MRKVMGGVAHINVFSGKTLSTNIFGGWTLFGIKSYPFLERSAFAKNEINVISELQVFLHII